MLRFYAPRAVLISAIFLFGCSEDEPNPTADSGMNVSASPDATSQDDSGAGDSDSGSSVVSDAASVIDSGSESIDSGSTVRDADLPAIDAGSIVPDVGVFDSGEVLADSGSIAFDGGLPRRDGSFPSFDGSLPSFDGSFPSFDGSFPSFDSGSGNQSQTVVSFSTTSTIQVTLNLMPIVAADPISVSIPLDFDNSGTTPELITFTQATLIMTGQATGGLPLPFLQRFSIGPGYLATPGQSSKTFFKTTGSGNPNMVTDPMQFCNQTFIVTLILTNGQTLFQQGTSQCVY